MFKPPLLLMAQNMHHAKMWMESHCMDMKDGVYISETNRIHGYSDNLLVKVDNWWLNNNYDLAYIMDYCKTHNIKIII